MTLAKEVQPSRLRLRYRVIQSMGCLAALLAFVFWAGAFSKRLAEADERARARQFGELHDRVRDLEKDARMLHPWVRYPERSASVLPGDPVP